MTFTVHEFRDLLTIIRTMPEWKAELRRELLGDEILSLPALIRQLTQDIAEMNKRLGHVERDVAVLKTDVAVLKTDVAVLKTDVAVLKTDMKQVKTDIAGLKGESVERKYREHPFVYFRDIIRKAKTLSDNDLEELVGKALDDQVLNKQEVNQIGLLDAVIRGKRVSDGKVAYLAVEASVKIDDHDVERAAQRAKLLEKIPGVIAVPVVAGELITPEGLQAATAQAVWYVTNGVAIEAVAP